MAAREVDEREALRAQVAELTRELERLLELTELLPELVFELDSDGTITYANRAGVERTGYSLDDLARGLRAVEILIPEDRERARRRIARLFAGESLEPEEYTALRKDGSTVPVQVCSAAIRSGGKVVGVRGVIIDLSRRKAAEEERLEALTRYRQLVEHAPYAIVVHQDGKLVYANPTACELLGYETSEVVGKPVIDFVQPDQRSLVADRIRLSTSGEAVPLMEQRWLHADGSVREMEVMAVPFSEGGRSAALVMASDVGWRRRAEARQREAEQRFQAIFRSPINLLYLHDLEGRFIDANDTALSLLGYTRDEIRSLHLRDLLEPEDLPRAHERVQAILEHGVDVGAHEFRVRARSGARLWLETSGVRMDRDGAPYAILGTARELTQRKQVEEALRRAVSAEKLAREEADRANRAKSDFLANMSHEIRTPMTGVITLSRLLLDMELPSEAWDFAVDIHASATGLKQILDDVLDVSKIEAGKLELQELDFDLRWSLASVDRLFRPRAEAKGLRYALAVDPDVPTRLRGDPGRLRQVLTNLVGNAIKFTDEGEVMVRVSLDASGQERVLLRFTVSDTGPGLPKERSAEVFDAFVQLDAAQRVHGGTGLGLAIARRLAEMMGGRIGFESVRGQGSTFWFTASLGRQPVATEEAPPAADLEGRRVLVVSDLGRTRDELQQMLEELGCRAEASDDVAAAVQRLRASHAAGQRFDAALVSLLMPGRGGRALSRQVEEDEALHGTPLVLVTSTGMPGEPAIFQKLGFAGYLTEPVSAEELRGCLARALAGERDVSVPIMTRHSLREQGDHRILLAEDNAINRKAITRMLELAGFRLDAVADGAQALAALERERYDLVLMDVRMPVMDGLEATRRIRDPGSAVRRHDLPIVALTAGAMDSDRERCREAGMDDYLAKPVTRRALVEALRRHLGLASPPPPAPSPKGDPREVYDRADVLDRIDGNEELLAELVADFLATGPELVAAVRAALDRESARELEHAAHALKGTAGLLGAARLQKAAQALERAGKERDLERARPLLLELQHEHERFRAALAREPRPVDALPEAGGSRDPLP
jgi:PAS domain S-box-containing protein